MKLSIFPAYRSMTLLLSAHQESFGLKYVPKGVDRTLESSARNIEHWNGIHDAADKAYESTDNQVVLPLTLVQELPRMRMLPSKFLQSTKIKNTLYMMRVIPKLFYPVAEGHIVFLL